jgi:oligosaccharide repeat unit polymerase
MGYKNTNIGIQFSIFITTALLLLYLINFLNILNISDRVLIGLMLAIFFWAYFNAGYAGMAFSHPYRLYLLVFFLFNMNGFAYCLLSNSDFFDFSFGAYSKGIFTNFVRTETLFSIAFFLISIHAGALISIRLAKIKIDAKNFNLLDCMPENSNAKKVGIILFLLFLIPSYYYYFTIITEAYLIGGYQEYVNSEPIGTQELPLIIRSSKDFFIFGFWLYLSGLPSKRNLIFVIIFYITPFILLSIFTGSRVSAVSQCIAILVYLTMIKRINNSNILIISIAMFFFAGFVGAMRTQLDYDIVALSDSINAKSSNPVEDTILQLGASAHTISLTVASVENNTINHSIMFFLEPFFGQTGYQPGKAAAEYVYLADRLSYYYMNDFMYGSGTGSSIVAEFYAVGGMIGVILIPFAYIICFFWMMTRINGSVSFLFFLVLLPGFFYTARSHPLTPILFAKHQIILIIIYIGVNWLFKMTLSDQHTKSIE